MAQNAYFFDAILSGGVYDRAYSSDDFAKYFAELVGNGVVYNVSTALQVVSSSGMGVNVSAGAAFLQGRKYENTAALALTLSAANGSLPRIDRIVIRLNKTNRTIAAAILAGTASSSPAAPALTQSADIYEISLARVYVGAGVSAVTTANITDERLDDAVCGIVTGLIKQIDATTLFTQLEAQFNIWFQSIQGQLSTDAAGNLQTQINTLTGQVGYSGTTSGSVPAYTVTINDFTLAAGVKIEVKIHASCTSAASLNITSHNTSTNADTVLGAKPIVDSYGSAINYLTENSYLTLVYNGSAFQVMGLATQYARYA